MEEKYISMFTQGESWTDWRRTGYPTLSADPLWYLTEIPRRMPYPESEYLYNNQQVPMPEDATFDERYGISVSIEFFGINSPGYSAGRRLSTMISMLI